jgi:predicted nucleotidyltransferase
MISWIKSGYWNILQLFYTNKSAKLHLREIARKSKLHGPSTTRFLRALEKDNIVKSEKDGNQKKYFLNLNQKTYSIFELFDLEKFNSLPAIRRNAIKYFIEYLKEKPLIIIIFGSTAKESFKDISDIDLLLITNSKIDTEEAEKHSEALTGIKISIFQMKLKDFLKEIKLKEDQVIQSAIFSGYPIFNNKYYYEVINNGS